MNWVKRYGLQMALLAAAIFALIQFFWRASQPVIAVSSAPLQIVLDAGHGGEDGGASANGVQESHLNLEISLRVRDLFALIGTDPVMIRTTDTAVYTPGEATTIMQKKVSDLKNRVATINSIENALLISIHQNSFPEEKYHGAQVFYAGTAESKALGVHLQEQFAQFLDPDNRRQSKSADQTIYLMQHIQCTGVLVECGFLTNKQEAQQLQNAAYQKRLAATLVGAAAGYLEGESADGQQI